MTAPNPTSLQKSCTDPFLVLAKMKTHIACSGSIPSKLRNPASEKVSSISARCAALDWNSFASSSCREQSDAVERELLPQRRSARVVVYLEVDGVRLEQAFPVTEAEGLAAEEDGFEPQSVDAVLLQRGEAERLFGVGEDFGVVGG